MNDHETQAPDPELTPRQRALLADLVGSHFAQTDGPAVARAYADLRSALDALRIDFASVGPPKPGRRCRSRDGERRTNE